MSTLTTIDKIIAASDENGFITGDVTIPLIDIVYCDLDGFYDRLAELLVDDIRLCEIDFDVIGTADNDCVVLRVTGDASAIIDARLDTVS
jgi:hypothetical protein